MYTCHPYIHRGQLPRYYELERVQANFHSKAAYDLLEEEASCDEEAEWASLFKGKIPPKLKHFFWLARQDRLLTNKVRLTRHLTTDCSCKSCGFPVENCLHILRDCPMARPVWEQLIPHNLHQHFFGLNLGICSVTAAELWSLYHGLMIAWMEGHRKVAVTVDSSAVVTLVSREPERTNPHAPLISACLTRGPLLYWVPSRHSGET